VVLLGYQVCLNSAPLLMEWRFGHAQPAAVGAFVTASTYFRIPVLLVGGILTHALVEMSHAWGAGDLTRFRRGRTLGLRRLLLTVIGISAVLTVAAPVLLRAYYGAPLGLPIAVLLALPVSTVIAQTAVMVVQGLLATDRGRTAALLWTVGGGMTVLLLSLSHGLDVWVQAGLVLGPFTVLIGGLLADRNRYPDTGPAELGSPPFSGARAEGAQRHVAGMPQATGSQ
jgi:O-antigen/teichoic acid export membrane protein